MVLSLFAEVSSTRQLEEVCIFPFLSKVFKARVCEIIYRGISIANFS